MLCCSYRSVSETGIYSWLVPGPPCSAMRGGVLRVPMISYQVLPGLVDPGTSSEISSSEECCAAIFGVLRLLNL